MNKLLIKNNRDAVGAIEIGSTAIRSAAGCFDAQGRLDLLGAASRRFSGIMCGEVVDRFETVQAMKEVAEQVKIASGMTEMDFIVGLQGSYVRKWKAPLNDFAGLPLDDDEEIFHLFNDAEMMFHSGAPSGASDKRGLVVSARKKRIDEILECLNEAEIPIKNITWSPLALAFLHFRKFLQKNQALLIDLGETETTVIMKNNVDIPDIFSLKQGELHAVNRLAVEFAIQAVEARRLKRKLGCSLNEASVHPETFRIPGIKNQIVEINKAAAVKKLRVHFYRLMQKIKDIAEEENPAFSPDEVILTGEGACTRGLPAFIQTIWGANCGKHDESFPIKGSVISGDYDNLSTLISLLFVDQSSGINCRLLKNRHQSTLKRWYFKGKQMADKVLEHGAWREWAIQDY